MKEVPAPKAQEISKNNKISFPNVYEVYINELKWKVIPPHLK
jgi:hypothetical protein